MTIARPGTVYLVGAGPGDPELLTRKAADLLATADIVLHDDLVTEAVLALTNPRACIINVGKRCGAKSITQDGINRLMIENALRPRAVVRLKSGDPLVFGRAGEEMDSLRAAAIPFEIVPGITAAFAAAAALQCSLTDRRASSSILFSSGHHASNEQATTAVANSRNSQPTRIVYMPGRDLTSLAREWRAEGLPASFPCVLVSRAAQPDQQVMLTTLAELDRITPGPAPLLLLAGWVFENLDEASDLIPALVACAGISDGDPTRAL